MSKTIRAVASYCHPGFLNFKILPYEAWKRSGGLVAEAHYPWRWLHGLIYRWELPSLWKNRKEARLRFVEPVSLHFDTFPDYLCYEIIPFIWDCWPCYDKQLITWLRRKHVKSCIFTSQQAADRIRKAMPKLNILVITEGIDVTKYNKGKSLNDRRIDLYTFGRIKEQLINLKDQSIVEERGGSGDILFDRLQNSKITIALPRCDVQPEITGGQETLTQRFWECMLSRIIMVGRAPKELTSLIGYNPVVPIDYENYKEQLHDILAHLEDYQSLVDKNRETALRMASWDIRIKQVMKWLEKLGYKVQFLDVSINN